MTVKIHDTGIAFVAGQRIPTIKMKMVKIGMKASNANNPKDIF
jgi:hypothetical protein